MTSKEIFYDFSIDRYIYPFSYQQNNYVKGRFINKILIVNAVELLSRQRFLKSVFLFLIFI